MQATKTAGWVVQRTERSNPSKIVWKFGGKKIATLGYEPSGIFIFYYVWFIYLHLISQYVTVLF